MSLNQHKCPACRIRLEAAGDGSGRFVAWCSNPRCPSGIADNGALGDTPEQAGDNLIKHMNEERDWE